MAEKIGGSTVVEQSSFNCEIKGLNPAVCSLVPEEIHREKNNKKY
jgi:hypothetical protein